MYVADLFTDMTPDASANHSTCKLGDDMLSEVADRTTESWVGQGHDPTDRVTALVDANEHTPLVASLVDLSTPVHPAFSKRKPQWSGDYVACAAKRLPDSLVSSPRDPMCSRIWGSVEAVVDIPLDLLCKSMNLQCAMDISPMSLATSRPYGLPNFRNVNAWACDLLPLPGETPRRVFITSVGKMVLVVELIRATPLRWSCLEVLVCRHQYTMTSYLFLAQNHSGQHQ